MNNRFIITFFTFLGIPLRIHLTFFLFFGWIILTSGGSWQQSIVVGLFVLGVFLCVLLHELGHALTAKYFGISTKDITLYPFGGIALLARMPEAKEEFWIALAGPCINVIIAGGLTLLIDSSVMPFFESSFLQDLAHTNLVIAVFNMIPALPMDGGRILRSLMLLLGIKNATSIATKLSQGCSVLLMIAGFYYGSAMLVIIAAVVSLGAIQEAVVSHTKNSIEGKLTKEFMIERSKLYEFSHGTTLSDALPIALKSIQDIFPVLYNERLIGVISRSTLIDVATTDPSNQYISSLMNRHFISVEAEQPIAETMRIAEEHQLQLIPVLSADQFVGIIVTENVSEYMMVNSVREDSQLLQEQMDQDDAF